ncbi:MAG: putative transport system permease protein [Pseudonocardiales bacterium]|nr:putative transport system permease protein [Pseudonocardiales bacterium]
MTAFAWAWTRRELRRSWVALAVLCVLVALASATVFAALAGARRQASVSERLTDLTRPAEVAILTNAPGYPWDRVRALPEVATLAEFGFTLPIDGLPPAAEAEPLRGADILRTIERPVVRAGRVLDPARLDEAVVSPGFASAYGRGVGDTADIVLPTPAELQAQGGSGPGGAFTGPRIHVHIVGVVVTPWFADNPGTPGELLMSPAVAERYPRSVIGDTASPKTITPTNALVRLRGGLADVPRLRADLTALPGVSGVDVEDLRERYTQPFQRQATFTARCLVAFGLAALLAALVLIGSVSTRYIAGRTEELLLLRPSGLTRADALLATVLPALIAGAAGVALGTGGAVLLSDRLPLGAARLAEPTPGRMADWPVFVPGIAAALLCFGMVGALAARRTWNAASVTSATPHRSLLAGMLFRAGAPVPVVIGTRFALEPGRGVRRVPVRAALAGVVAGVLGVAGAITFSHGVSDAATHPERFGQTYQLTAYLGDNGYDIAPPARVRAALETDPSVVGIDDVRVSVATGPAGVGSVALLTYSWGRKPLDAAVAAGRLPTGPGEVLLTPTSMRELHTAVGDTVSLTGTTGSRSFTVVGRGFLPVGFHNSYADGGWLTDAGYDSIFDTFRFHMMYVAVRGTGDGADPAARLNGSLRGQPELRAVRFTSPDPLPEVFELHEVRQLPRALGAFLAVLAAGAAGYAIVAAVRRRRQELAVLRVLGLTRRQSAAAVATQATVFALLGLLFGIPLGLALARTMWQGVADSYPFEYRAPWTPAVWLVVPGVLVVTNLLAAWPAWRAGRLRVADVLRAE